MIAVSSNSEVLYTLVSPNEESYSFFGISVSGAGDVNGDGYDDVVVGAATEDPGSSPDRAGRAYVFDGRTGFPLHTLISPNEEEWGHFGCSVSGAGDVNGDTYDDVVVGAQFEDPGTSPIWAGRAYVFDGQTGTPLHALASPNEEQFGAFGVGVSSAGDVNGDGYGDVVIGAVFEGPGSSPDSAGRAYVFDGQTGILLYALASPGEEYSGHFGCSVSGAGDINGDGCGDVVVGAEFEDPGTSPYNAGRAYVFDGQTGGPLYTLISPNEQAAGHFGCSVSGAGDINGDGYGDLMVGANQEHPGTSPNFAGRAYVFDGRTGFPLHTLVSPNEDVQGFFGSSVSGAGDVNGDGYDDVVVGAELEDPDSSQNVGRAYVFDGQTGIPLYTLVSPNEQEHGRFGGSVSGAGDINGDGYSDVVVGTSREHVWAGRAYVFAWMNLSSTLSGSMLELQWSMWSPASEHWIYGADNLIYFNPGFAPGYEYKVDEVFPPTTTWSSPSGIGDHSHNWTYLVIAVDETETELARSNRVGEHDFDTDIP
jgi:hypothetical protein